MNSTSDYRMENSGPNRSNVFDNGDVFSPRKCNNEEVEGNLNKEDLVLPLFD